MKKMSEIIAEAYAALPGAELVSATTNRAEFVSGPTKLSWNHNWCCNAILHTEARIQDQLTLTPFSSQACETAKEAVDRYEQNARHFVKQCLASIGKE